MIRTMTVVTQTSLKVGHVTFDTSWRTSSTKWMGFFTMKLTILIRRFHTAGVASWHLFFCIPDDRSTSDRPSFPLVLSVRRP